MKKILLAVLHILVLLMYLLSAVVFSAGYWVQENMNVSFSQILATITGNLDGFDFMRAINFKTLVKPVIVFVLMISLVVLFRIQEKKAGKHRAKRRRIVYMAVTLVLSVILICAVGINFDIWTQLKNSHKTTTLYEDYYVVPDSDLVSGNSDTNNLLMIYMESMETALADDADGGISGDVNYIPELTKLAKNNVSFSNGGTVGGLHCTYGADDTKMALVATTSGAVEYKNSLTLSEYYPSAPTIGEILKEKGYNNFFLCGSDSKFADMDKYLTDNGEYKIYDYYTAIEDGYIDKDHKVWWGYEDEILYKIAKEKLTQISSKGEKFNFIMQTMDTHYPSGYVCNLCKKEYEKQYLNVYACADRQIAEFIEWCSEQPWYEYTTIVITGDHPTMDKSSFITVPSSERTIYNCFINSRATPKLSEKTRTATTQDMFPTVLSAMGFEVKGGRLGLGTDLFSGEKTLSEQLGYSVFNDNLGMSSSYCIKNFVKEEPIPSSRLMAPDWLN